MACREASRRRRWKLGSDLVAATLALAAIVAAGCGAAAPGTADPGHGAGELVVREGSVEQRLVLTGVLEAEEAQYLPVPRTRAGQVPIRWLERSGAHVAAGQRVAELDSTSLSADLEDRRLAVVRAENEIVRSAAEAAEREAERVFDVERRQVELEKARLAASVPTALLAAREAEERALTLRRAEVALAKAEEDLAAQRRSAAADLEVRRLALEKTLREIALSEEGISALELTSPAAGVLLIAEHPWEGRRLQVGDMVWPGMVVAEIPDLATLRVVARLSDVDDGRLEVGMSGRCLVDAFPDEALLCWVREIGPNAEEEHRGSLRRFFRVVLEAEGIDPVRMRPGMSVRAEVTTGALDGVLLAPRAALRFGDQGPEARAAGAWRSLELGPCSSLDCVVLSGLEAGQRLARAEGEA
jgi:HlyD family secretion protein